MKKILDFTMIFCCMAVSFFCFASCSSDLDVQQEYAFTVEALPVADKIAGNETVEIRLDIKEEGHFTGTVYTLRYFQPDGTGIVCLSDGTVLKPNDRYLLSEMKFRLYYTSKSAGEAQTIDLYFENNWGEIQKLSFDFNAKDTASEEEAIPVESSIAGK
ncbi:DUF3872 domain-containing protein [Bacteroides reticulotermitis]|uniref:Conjugative transposon protein TraQ n=2 Tax=Bacteroides reticulotermitis TaxID=1133319 RepID=W4UVB8_9BACE|nr:DUF3872 domain-containing protein [Bacteroides reticulotermitis]MBB4045752.1 hypothetical protein [Bacteroides reticulotermitis]GAE84891.1 conjugative transposon protein TraQ [Bacteroides reticulotermitis JCM 10512]